MAKRIVKIKDEDDYLKDLSNNAILSNNIKGLEMYKWRKKKRQESQNEINTLKEKVEQLEKIIDSVDFDNNGYIEYEEFIRVTILTNHLFKEENLKIAFDMFDLDKNGTISLSEVKEVLGMGKSIDESVMKEIMSEINNQGDDEITYEQFKNIITSL